MGAIFGLFRALKVDVIKKQTNAFNNMPISEMSKSWQERLSAIIMLPSKKDGSKFINETTARALDEVRAEFEKNGLNAEVISGKIL